MKTSFYAVLLSLLFVSAQARSEEVKSYKTDLEYVFALLDSTSLNVDIHKSLYGLDAEKIKAAFRAQVDTVHSQEAFYRLVQQLLGCYHDPLARTLYPGNAYWLKGSKEAFQTFSYIFEINMIPRYYRWNRGFRGKWEGDAFIPELDNLPVYTFTKNIRLEKSRKSLNHSGKISILFDDGVSFASLSLRRFVACFPDKFVVLEDELDYVGDLALPPFEYVLPYSQIMICIPACAGVDAISKILAE